MACGLAGKPDAAWELAGAGDFCVDDIALGLPGSEWLEREHAHVIESSSVSSAAVLK